MLVVVVAVACEGDVPLYGHSEYWTLLLCMQWLMRTGP